MAGASDGEDDGNGAAARRGPLAGVRVVELAGRGPGPFGVMVLADLGADVVRVARVEDVAAGDDESATERALRGHRRFDLVTRGRPSVALDLKHPDGVAAALRLVDAADVLVEGFRPGVAERLGLGPDMCLGRNPRLVYARMTGFGQDGPYAKAPGHDINYVALAGALEPLRRPGQPPAPPLNLLGDYGGGGMLLVVGVLAALVERAVSGRGQVVDAAMVDGVALLTTLLHGMRAEGSWSADPGSNILGLAAPFYNVYETADGRHVAVGAGEHQFYARLLALIGLEDGEDKDLIRQQSDPATWPATKERLAAVFRTRTLDEWSKLLEGTDTCFTPVLTPAEAARHPHNVARGTFVEVDGVVQPAPAPRFSRTPAGPAGRPTSAGEHTRAALLAWGFAEAEVDVLLAAGAARQAGGVE
ncbi:CoA transferase [Frankia sp. CNm7]|uniref:CoA transferase n=1 Tax=Frankia nepalensis TaxID=1836974 RepID=A0A937RIF5_9ACTN|nr:CaiB/BaiF CoA-transferase family protein [Frankia nepalensis]MBL7501707.1 CoA transferase [Frankia nepalensis]MBL7511565.1 CoA transferase [Frankia nepalensis]MBL7518575.1 CoA transferase [Frankia nepalensis]MBL7626591.1 CoA transferase [Frankia nepalensis]